MLGFGDASLTSDLWNDSGQPSEVIIGDGKPSQKYCKIGGPDG